MATDPRLAMMQQMAGGMAPGAPAQPQAQAQPQGADPMAAVAGIMAELGAMPPKQAITLATMKQQQASSPQEQMLWRMVISQLNASMQQGQQQPAPNPIAQTLNAGFGG